MATGLAVLSGSPESLEAWSQVGWWKDGGQLVFFFLRRPAGSNFVTPTFDAKKGRFSKSSDKTPCRDSEGFNPDRPRPISSISWEANTRSLCDSEKPPGWCELLEWYPLTISAKVKKNEPRAGEDKRSLCCPKIPRKCLAAPQDPFQGFIKFCRFCGLLLEYATQSPELWNSQLLYLSFLYDSSVILQKTCAWQ